MASLSIPAQPALSCKVAPGAGDQRRACRNLVSTFLSLTFRSGASSWLSHARLSPPRGVCARRSRVVVAQVQQSNTPATGKYIGKLGSDSATTRAAAGAATGQVAAQGAPGGAGGAVHALRQRKLKPVQVFLPLALAVLVPVVGGVLVSTLASPLQDWYQDLRKPEWEPPDWMFGAVWSALYVFMGLASFLVWADGGWTQQGPALRLYASQLALNFMWPIVFFKRHQILPGAIILGILIFLVNATMRAFYPVNHVAAWLLLPYQAWVIFAFILNVAIWRLNRSEDGGLPGASWSATPRSGDW